MKTKTVIYLLLGIVVGVAVVWLVLIGEFKNVLTRKSSLFRGKRPPAPTTPPA